MQSNLSEFGSHMREREIGWERERGRDEEIK